MKHLTEALQRKIESKTYAPRMSSKSKALEYYKSKKYHKKRPEFKPKEKPKSDYKKMSIEEYEAKYPLK